MKLGAMIGDVLRSLVKTPATSHYPAHSGETPPLLRGQLRYNPEQCTGCGLCTKDCPASAIELVMNDKVNKRFVLRYDVSRCTFCGQCVQSCRFDCLELAHDRWELATLTKDTFVSLYGKDDDVQLVREPPAGTGADLGG